jgi:glycine cleavage system H lipoate-binding protein
MLTHDFLSIYPAKLAEYVLAISYMVAFIGWWKWVNGGRRAEVAVTVRPSVPAEAAHAGAEVAVPAAAAAHGWFQVPADVWLHPGHTWARPSEDGTVAVGLDDFAARLVGPVAKVSLPKPGAPVAQGVAAVALSAAGKTVPMLSPVDGVVSEVNEALAGDPTLLSEPFAQGWLFKVRPARLRANERQLLHGESARRWLDLESGALAARANPELGRVLQDGGAPVSGIAQELDAERWDEIARGFFLTQGA